MADATSQDRTPVDLRIILWLGLLVAAWLLLAPTTTIDGRSCGTPIFHLSAPAWDQTPLPDETCLDRNRVRLDQAIVTTVGTLLVTGTAALRRWLAVVRPPAGNARLSALTYPEAQTSSDPQ